MIQTSFIKFLFFVKIVYHNFRKKQVFFEKNEDSPKFYRLFFIWVFPWEGFCGKIDMWNYAMQDKGEIPLTYYEICARFEAAGLEDAAADAAVLLAYFGGISTATLPFRKNENIVDPRLARAVEQRANHYPLQYLVGEWGFCGQTYEVNEHTLIPRSDTETLVEEALKLLPRGACFADLCTGSGCIAVATLDLRDDTRADVYELYPKTLALAQKNAEHNKVSDRFSSFCGDVLDGSLLGEKKYDAIISNPPYIRSDVIPTLQKEVLTEPHAALDGGEDGLIFYRSIVEKFADNLKENGFFLFEIGYDQADDLRRIAEENGFECEIYKDLCACDRAALLRPKNS